MEKNVQLSKHHRELLVELFVKEKKVKNSNFHMENFNFYYVYTNGELLQKDTNLLNCLMVFNEKIKENKNRYIAIGIDWKASENFPYSGACDLLVNMANFTFDKLDYITKISKDAKNLNMEKILEDYINYLEELL